MRDLFLKMKKIQIKCKLTHKTGKPAKSHLIPRALTNLHKSQKSRVEVGYKGQKETRHDSWYDLDLCTTEGELILSKIDDFGIEELREQRLIWDSWGPHNNLNEVVNKDLFLTDDEEGVRLITFNNPQKIEIFFLSLLWRAAASKRTEMQDVSLEESEIEKLRLIINDNKFEFIKEFPVTLIQLSTKGPIHNRTPYTENVLIEDVEIKQARIYFDGLIARISINPKDVEIPPLSGKEGKSLVICKSFEKSLSKDQIIELAHAHTDPNFLYQKKEIIIKIEEAYKTQKQMIIFGTSI